MKTLTLLFICALLIHNVFTVKKNVKTITTALAQQTSDPDLSDMDIHKVMNDMATNFDDLNRQEIYDNVDDTRDNYRAEINAVSQAINAQKPLTLNCEESATQDCLSVEMREHAKEYKLFYGDIKFIKYPDEQLARFWVFATPVCGPIELPTPYLENKVIKVCLTASSTAKRVAEKSVKTTIAGTFGAGAKFHNTRKYRCKHMLMDGKGGHKLTSSPCVDFSEGTNLVQCFFELHSEFKFNMNYECFYPQLWKTWYESFKKVYHAMKAKGYAISTDNLQSRYCYYDRSTSCDHQTTLSYGVGVALGATCGPNYNNNYCMEDPALPGVKVYCAAREFVSSLPTLNRMQINGETHACDFVAATTNGMDPSFHLEQFDSHRPHDTLEAEECTGESRTAPKCLVTYQEFCDHGLTAANSTDAEKVNAYEQLVLNPNYYTNQNLYCTDIAEDGYSTHWDGLYCGTRNEDDQASMQAWAECSNEYPINRIKELLELGATEFPEAEFEKRSPTTMIMVGFDQQCKKRFTHEHPENQPDHTDADYDACMTHYYNDATAEDVDHLCTKWTNEHLMKCLYNHGHCDEYADTDNLEPENWRVWESTCGAGQMEEGKQCDPRQFKQLCFEEKWSGWDFNTGNANADYNGDGVITDEENAKFHMDMASESLLGGITDAFHQNALDANAEHNGTTDFGVSGQQIIDDEEAGMQLP